MLIHDAGPFAQIRRIAASRCAGPGGYCNLGNALGLVSGLTFQLAGAADGGLEPLALVATYVFSSPGATALTAAMVMFFASGELYHRAWSGHAPDAAMLFRLLWPGG